MPTPKGYTTIDKVENYLLIDVATYFEPQITEWICDIETFIEQFTGRVFKADAAATVRYFDGNGTRRLLVDDGTALEEIKLSRGENPTTFETADNGTDFFLYPANLAFFNRIELAGGIFPYGQQNIAVKAKWGYSASVPNDIVLAATILVAGVINFNAPETGEDIQSETIGRYSVTYKDRQGFQDFELAMNTLKSYQSMNV